MDLKERILEFCGRTVGQYPSHERIAQAVGGAPEEAYRLCMELTREGRLTEGR